jgi:hypothetical protein
MNTVSPFQWELANNLNTLKFEIEKRFADLTYRLKSGIYLTPQDETAEQVWARKNVADESEPWNMFGTFAALAELEKRGQIEGWNA